jgi:hypothetical protein
VRFPLFISAVLLLLTGTVAQPWTYDFGNTTGSYTTPSGVSLTFLPDPPAGGGTDSRVRVGSGGGGFYLENPSYSTDPTGVRLRIEAASGSSVNKFSIYDYSSPTNTFTMRFNIRFTGGLSASPGSSSSATRHWFYMVGDGSDFNSSGGFTSSQVFAALKFEYNATSTVGLTYRNASGSWVNTGLTDVNLNQDTDYYIHVYGNNSSVTATYTDLIGNSQNLAAYSVDLWINGHLAGDDISKGQLAAGANIDSWMFFGQNSTSNTAEIILDDIVYSNSIVSTPLPVELTDFTATPKQGDVLLNWVTASELNNQYFLLQYAADGHTWQTIEQVAGAGTTNETQYYSYTHRQCAPGYAYYRLIQVDENGEENYSEVASVFVPATTDFPFIANPLGSDIFLPAGYELSIFDLQGRLVLHAFSTGQEMSTQSLQAGVYLATLRHETGEQTIRLVKQ